MKEKYITKSSTAPSLVGVARQKSNAARTARTKVVVGGKITVPDPTLPFIERMVTGKSAENFQSRKPESAYSKAVLSSVAINIEAGVRYLESQENSLSEMGGKLSEIAALLTASRSPHTTEPALNDLQVRFETARDGIKQESMATHDYAALYSVEKSPPVVVAVPSSGEWEGLALDRVNLGTPGMITIETGKICGNSSGLCLDEGSVKRALSDWRNACVANRLQWGLLVERLHRVSNRMLSLESGKTWSLPKNPESLGFDGIRKPHLGN
jgi:hypothetical protein